MRKMYILLMLLTPFSLLAQDGSLDLSFGDNGAVELDYGNDHIHVRGVNQFSDGSYMVLARKLISSENSILLHKFLNDGSLDLGFGDNGVLSYITDPAEYPNSSWTVDGNMTLFSFIRNGQLTFKRFTSNGSADGTFGVNGELNPFPSSVISSSYFTNYNKIVVGMSVGNGVAIKRYTVDGLSDTAFGTNGEINVTLPVVLLNFNSVSVTSDDSIFITAKVEIDNDEKYVIIKFNEDGTVNTAFGSGGIVEVPFEFYSEFMVNTNSLRFFNNGDILIASRYADFFNGWAISKMYKINSEGIYIPSFGDNGLIFEYGLANVKIQQNQRLLVVYEGTWGGYIKFKRYHVGGDLDLSFDFIGTDYPEFYDTQFIIDNDGKIFIGTSKGIIGEDLLAYRLTNNPLEVESFEFNTISIAPNPINHRFSLSCSNCSVIGEGYTIADATGKIILRDTFNSNEPSIDISSFSAGLYFLNTTGTTIKLIKK